MACVDTTVLLDLGGRGGRQLKTRAEARLANIAQMGEGLVTTRLNLAECYVGLSSAADRRAEEAKLRGMLRLFAILEFDDRAARRFGEVTAYLRSIGRPAGDMDVLIAATAQVNGEALVTRNASHFANIPGLTVVEY